MRYIVLTAVLLGSLISQPVHAEDVNAGFVQGLWYSEEKVFVDNPTRIYVALRNNTDHDLIGTVRFSVNGTRIGSSEVRALSGRLVEAWVDWVPEYGTHTVVANVSNAELHVIGEGTQQIDIEGMVAEDTLFVDIDTDGDGIGNEEDEDDDNDSVSDEDELERGSDPLTPNPELVDESEEGEETEQTEDEEVKVSTPTEPKEGLERFFDDGGTTDDLFSSVTQKIEETKKSLDEYREERKEDRQAEKEESPEVSNSEDTGNDNATITRSRVEPKVSILERFINLAGSLIDTIWSLVLAIFSFLLGFPALLELILLWLLLIIIYRLARRYGRRRMQ